MFRKVSVSLCFFLILGSTICFADHHDMSVDTISATQVKNNIFLLQVKGGNIAFLTGKDGVLMIDSDYAASSETVHAAIREQTSQPIKYLVNTHFHGDHTGGNKHFGLLDATIIGHENVRKRLSTDQMIKLFDMEMPAADHVARPKITFESTMSLFLNGQPARLKHYPNAHTDGDVVVFFDEANVIHTGDLYFAGMYPFFDVDNGGDIEGLLSALTDLVSLSNDETKIIPGHGPLSTRDELKESLKMMTRITEKVQKEIKRGRSLEKIQSKNLTKKFDAKFGGGFLKGDVFVSLVYQSLTH